MEEKDSITRRIVNLQVVVTDHDPTCFSPTFLRENRRHSILNQAIQLCRKLISEFGIEDQREKDYLLAKIGMMILGQSMLGLQNQLVEMDHEADLALEKKLGKLSDYLIPITDKETSIDRGTLQNAVDDLNANNKLDEGHSYEDCLKHGMPPTSEKSK